VRLICGWLGVVCAWSTHATVGSGRDWLGVVVARQADLSDWLGATGRCASTVGLLVLIELRLDDPLDSRHQITHFGDDLPSQSLGLVLKNY